MENFKKFLSKYGAAIVFGLSSILFLIFAALPIATYVMKIDGEKYYSAVSVYELFNKGILNFNGTLVPFEGNAYVTLTFVLVVIAIALGATGLTLSLITDKCKSLAKGFVGSSIGFTLVGIVLFSFLQGALNESLGMSEALAVIKEVEFAKVGFALVMISLILMILGMLREAFANTHFTIQEVVEMAMLIALAIALDKLTLWKAPTGGSINLAGIPLLILAMRFGPLKGMLGASVVFGLLSCLIDGYGFHTYPFDYFIAFAGYGACGLAYWLLSKYAFKKDTTTHKLLALNIAFVIGGISVLVTRMVGSTASSMIYWGMADDLPGALLYNIGYVGPSAAIVTAACCALSYPLMMINKRFPVKKDTVTTETVETEEK